MMPLELWLTDVEVGPLRWSTPRGGSQRRCSRRRWTSTVVRRAAADLCAAQYAAGWREWQVKADALEIIKHLIDATRADLDKRAEPSGTNLEIGVAIAQGFGIDISRSEGES